MKFGSLFSGIGGFELGFENVGMECIWQVEKDQYCRSVLEKHWVNVERFIDVRTVGKHNLEPVNLICGGFPCKDLSLAGRREGLRGEESGLWFEFERIIKELLPKWIVIENVPGLLSSNGGEDFKTVIKALDELGYGVSWRVLDSQYFGVPQRRRRVFIVASLGDTSCAQILFNSESPNRYEEKTVAQKNNHSDNRHGDILGTWWDGRDRTMTLDRVLYKHQAMPEKNRLPAALVPAWRECPMCEDYWCNIHKMHVGDCTCAPTDTWLERGENLGIELYPYSPCILRYITPTECELLQGFPAEWTAYKSDGKSISDSQRYKMCGNTISVPVAKWIGNRIISIDNVN